MDVSTAKQYDGTCGGNALVLALSPDVAPPAGFMQYLYPLAARAALSLRRFRMGVSLLLLALLLLPGRAHATVYYVATTRPDNTTLTDNTGDGRSWGTAKKDVQEAINLATAVGDEVWVKAGTYLPTLVPPTTTTPTTARDRTFFLINTDLKLYGGFAGTENAATQRNPAANLTTLSGDLDGSAGTLDAYHVLLTLGRSNACVVDGFTVRGGRADVSGNVSVQPAAGAAVNVNRNSGAGLCNIGSSPTVSNCTMTGNTIGAGGRGTGSGMYNSGSNPQVSSCAFSSNTSVGMANTGSSPTVSNCTFSSNTGNGMFNAASSNSVVTGCTFSGNTSTGMANITSSSPVVSYCTFSGNGNSGSGTGGGMSNSSGSPAISNCTFSGNNIGSGGGAGMANSGSSATVSNCSFVGNICGNGGGIYNTGNGLTISRCSFSGNTASNGGGGIYISSGNTTVSNCVFSGNSTRNLGGGMFVDSGSPAVSNCTFSGNTASSGGALCYFSTGGGSLTNCILYQNTSSTPNREEIFKTGTTPALTINYCIVRDAAGTAPALTVTNATLSNCYTSAPGYVDSADPDGPDDTWGTADDGLRLGCGSFAVDKGTGSTPATDLLGNPRKGLMDLGAYEATGSTDPLNAIPAATTTVSGAQTAAALPYTDCQNQLLLLDATGAYTLRGSTIATVRVLATAPTYNTRPYVRRFYDIAPAANAATATAEATLYFTQADFDDYNTARGTLPALPLSAADPEGYAANLRITQKHGSSATGTPGSYTGWAGTGPATVFLTPAAVTYNATAARWEVRFPVAGFSGFFAHTGSRPLPVELTQFTAQPEGAAAVRLAWATASEKNSAAFEVERSSDGAAFTRIGTVAAAGGSSTPRTYSLLDTRLPASAGPFYYRLRLVDADGTFSYSPVRTVARPEAAGLTLSPNPAQDGTATLRGAAPGTKATVLDALGHAVATATADATGTAVLRLPTGLAGGVYIVRVGATALRLTVE